MRTFWKLKQQLVEAKSEAAVSNRQVDVTTELWREGQAELERLKHTLQPLADNVLADDPVWCARWSLREWHWADNRNAPTWFKEAAEQALSPQEEGK